MKEDSDHKRRLIDTKKRMEKHYGESDKKRKEEDETAEGSETRNAEAKRVREEQCE